MTSSVEILRRVAIGFALVALWAGATWFKASRVLENPEFSRLDDTALFADEGALRYRYAKLQAAGLQMPARDRAVMWPQGVSPREADSWVVEKLTASVYRGLIADRLKMPFHVFLIWCWSALTALAVWPIYALSRHLWQRSRAGLVSACLWVGSFGGLHASSAARLSAADVAMPWLFLMVHLALTAVARRSTARALLAAGCCWWTLTMWPGAQWFLFLLVVVAAAIDYRLLTIDLVTEARPLVTPRTIQGRSLYLPASLLGLAMVGAGLTAPALAAQGVAWSFPVIFGAGWVLLGGVLRRMRLPARWRLMEDVARFMPRAFRWRRRLVPLGLYLLSFTGLVTVALLTRWLTRSKLADYPLWARLVAAKIEYFGQMPLAPYALNDDVRLLWAQALPSPDAAVLWGSAGGLLLLVPLAVTLPYIQARHAVGSVAIASGARVTLPLGRAVLMVMTIVTAVLWVLAARLDGWFAWSAAVMAGSLVDFALNVGRYPPLWRLGHRPRLAAAVLLALALVVNVIGLRYLSGVNEFPNRSQVLSLVKQIRYRTEPSATLLAPPALSGTLAADTGRPVVLQNDALKPGHRKRLREFGDALFGKESDLAGFCERHGARYLIVAAATMTDLRPGGLRYDSNHMIVSRECVAYRLHFAPETLGRFQLTYTGPQFRLYKALEAGADAAKLRTTPIGAAYFPTWKSANFSADRLQLAPQ